MTSAESSATYATKITFNYVICARVNFKNPWKELACYARICSNDLLSSHPRAWYKILSQLTVFQDLEDIVFARDILCINLISFPKELISFPLRLYTIKNKLLCVKLPIKLSFM